MKKLLFFLLIICLSVQSAFAWEYNPKQTYNPMSRDEKAVNKLLKSQVKYANKCNLKKFVSTYDKDFISSDGLDLPTFVQMVKEIWIGYDNVKYDINIKSIKVDGASAIVQAEESSTAFLPLNKFYSGELNGLSKTEYRLRNKNGRWKVLSENILEETTSMLYGDAKDLDIKLTLPEHVKAGEEYCASLEFVPPEQTVAIASIAADIIEYPQRQVQEVFRTMPDDNMLERLFTANKNGDSEYVVASIGITKADVNEISINLKLTGFGYYIKRLNIESKNEDVGQDEKI